MSESSVSFSHKAASALIAAGVAASLCMPSLAFADVDPGAAITGPVTPSASVATGAATRAAMPALEILGINSVEESGQFISLVNGVPQYDWSQPKYYLAASNYNISPSAYLANLANGYAPAAVYNASRSGGGAGPDAALAEYGTDDTDNAVWDLHPTVVVGDGSGVDYSLLDTGELYDSNPGINYSITNYSTLISSMHDIAAIAEVGRYGNTDDLADLYEQYINNTVSYINDNKTETKAFVLVTNASGTTANNCTYTVMAQQSTDGTAQSNRYFETAAMVATNYAATDGETEIQLSSSQMKTAVQNGDIDLIMVGGQQSSGNYAAIMNSLEVDNLVDNTFFVKNNGSQGAMYGTIMNSVENAQNIGRIYGCLYPELIDQDAFLAYYYSNFYHINDADLAYVMSQAMDGVRNWNVQADSNGALSADAATEWSVSDIDITQLTDVEDIVDDGLDNGSNVGA